MNNNREFPEDFGDICEKVIDNIEKDKIKEKAKLKKALIEGNTTIHKFIIPALIIFALFLFIGFIRQ